MRDMGNKPEAVKLEEAAKDLFQAWKPELDSKTRERMWKQDGNLRERYMEMARVKENIRAFVEERGAELLERCGPQVRTFPDELIDFCEDEKRFLTGLKQCHLLLLTANQVEDRLITHLLFEYGGRDVLVWRDLEGKCCVRLARLGQINVAHLAPLGSGSFSRWGSQNAVECALKYVRPEFVVSLGVAFGADVQKQRLGDVLVSRKILSCDTNKRVDGKIILRGEETYSTNESLFARWGMFLESEMQLERRYGFRWYFGSLLSGGSVVSDAEEKQRLMEAADRLGETAIGGEMEGTGVYSECRKNDIPCVVIKGICDWAILKNGWAEAAEEGMDNEELKDCVQAFAARHAFTALCYLLNAAPIGKMPRLRREPPSPPEAADEGGKGLSSFCFSDLKKTLAGWIDPNGEPMTDEAFLRKLLPDYLCPEDTDAAMRGAAAEKIAGVFLRSRETALHHVLQKCRLLLQGREEGAFFRQVSGAVNALGGQGEAEKLCFSCYQRCTAGLAHAERGLAVLVTFALLGPKVFQELVPTEDDYVLFF